MQFWFIRHNKILNACASLLIGTIGTKVIIYWNISKNLIKYWQWTLISFFMLEYLVPIGVWDLTKNLKSIWKLCLISFFLFLGIHSFHLVNTSFLRSIKALSFDLDGIYKVTFTTGLTKKIPFIISAKNLKVILCSVTKGKWNPCDWKYIICLFKFWHERDVILQFCLSRTLHIFQFNIFILKESSKRYLFLSYLSTFFEK